MTLRHQMKETKFVAKSVGHAKERLCLVLTKKSAPGAELEKCYILLFRVKHQQKKAQQKSKIYKHIYTHIYIYLKTCSP